MDLLIAAVVGLVVGALATWVVCRALTGSHEVRLAAERDLLRQRVQDLERATDDEVTVATALVPLREALTRVERQVGTLERDRAEQFGQLGERLTEVTSATSALRTQTATLASSLNSTTIRGAWGEVQLRRVLEHAGLLARCDFDEQVSAVSVHDQAVRPDVVVRLPGGKCLVVDAKAPMTAFLQAQADGVEPARQQELLRAHATSLRGHVDTLADKAYWSAFSSTPEMVVCFVPGEAILATALDADPSLFDHAMSRKVVLASPATLLAMLRSVAFTWQQEALTANALQLLDLGKELYARLGTLGKHAARMGGSLRRSVEAYNQLVGALESRVLVTARRMNELELEPEALEAVPPVEVAPRPLTAAELVESELAGALADVDRPELLEDDPSPDVPVRETDHHDDRHTA
ncbi:MAG TPA: DNA recombination protein RmuC [Segeticoccus sp.]|uniref:DNA recombination protein RmuC n=1 Tax=Segeticoccus sp. TaxID=2706531 RepID=UPI002D7F52EC|nr:DNA recombination protein RmuC [Segeticoccus sp.]HET8599212.1 DNA recombination protein RmuC [Segeticoccus sp.]